MGKSFEIAVRSFPNVGGSFLTGLPQEGKGGAL